MYLLDADVFIRAKNSHYGFDIAPGFWEWLVSANEQGLVASVAAVAVELKAGEDDLAEWARERNPAFFLPPDDGVVASLRLISGWASSLGYKAAAVSEFLSSGDYYLIAHAHAGAHTVVTHETGSPESMKKIKIPDVCAAMSVECTTPFAMLRATGARLVLG